MEGLFDCAFVFRSAGFSVFFGGCTVIFPWFKTLILTHARGIIIGQSECGESLSGRDCSGSTPTILKGNCLMSSLGYEPTRYDLLRAEFRELEVEVRAKEKGMTIAEYQYLKVRCK